MPNWDQGRLAVRLALHLHEICPQPQATAQTWESPSSHSTLHESNLRHPTLALPTSQPSSAHRITRVHAPQTGRGRGARVAQTSPLFSPHDNKRPARVLFVFLADPLAVMTPDAHVTATLFRWTGSSWSRPAHCYSTRHGDRASTLTLSAAMILAP
jgi:hypothetical protein